MEFNHLGQRTRLHRLDRIQYKATKPAAIRKSGVNEAQFYNLTIEFGNKDLNPTFGSDIPIVFLNGLKDIISDFQDVFGAPTGLPPTREQDCHIPLLPGTAPVNIRPCRYPYFQKSEIEKLIEEMLSKGIIRPSNSPFSSPILLVKKKNGTWRFCVDYRGLNADTVKDHFLIPTVEELLDEVASARFFSKLDLRTSYHQV